LFWPGQDELHRMRMNMRIGAIWLGEILNCLCLCFCLYLCNDCLVSGFSYDLDSSDGISRDSRNYFKRLSSAGVDDKIIKIDLRVRFLALAIKFYNRTRRVKLSLSTNSAGASSFQPPVQTPTITTLSPPTLASAGAKRILLSVEQITNHS